jgi:hypothetical protein
MVFPLRVLSDKNFTYYQAALKKRAAVFSTTLLKPEKDRGLYGVAHDPFIYFNIKISAQ